MGAARTFPIIRAAFSGLLAMFVSVGVARFGFAPLVPALADAHWYSAATAFWLGTANLVGYFIGAAAMRVWRRPFAAKPAVLLFMGLTAAAMLGSALNWGWLWFGAWRLVSGVTGGVLMVLMAAAVVGRAPPSARGRVSGITFAGMGAGTAFSAILVPLLLTRGLIFTWLTFGVVCGLATLAVAVMMPPARIEPSPRHEAAGLPPRPVLLMIAAYALSALGFVPHMLFLSSFVALGLGRGVAAGAQIAAWLGVAAMLGPPLLGRVADRFGFLVTLLAGYVVMGCGVAAPLLLHAQAALIVSTAAVGVVALGAVMLVAGAIAGMVPAARLSGDWGLATMVYAVMQAVVAAFFSHLFHVTGSYALLFGIGTVAMAVSVLLIQLAARAEAR
ncbi:YbfB/YjiJ family MFS transporter [Acidocella sp.]|uniref:YbfB/YjiJ family MFS transporter n=1 Tax=Acidocella sp. TaxID=50710 RepID=UPI003D088124